MNTPNKAKLSSVPGDLAAKMDAAKQRVRSQPSEASARVFLFQMMVLTGEWQRALTQLQLAAQLDAAAIPMAQTYRELIRCEIYRESVFAGKHAPASLVQPPEWLTALGQVLSHYANGDVAAGVAVRDKALEDAPTVAGEIDGQPFAWLADCDSRIGPALEMIVDGQYVWLSPSDIASLRIDAPEDLRDLVWLPALLTLRGGGERQVFIPARYPGTAGCGNDDLMMSKLTEWRELASGRDVWLGYGQKMLATDEGDYSLLNIREIVFRANP